MQPEKLINTMAENATLSRELEKLDAEINYLRGRNAQAQELLDAMNIANEQELKRLDKEINDID